MKMPLSVLAASLMLGALHAPAQAQVVSGTVSVTAAHMYADYGGGDVTFSFSTPIDTCIGAWIAPAQPGAKTLIATLLAARLSSRQLQVWVNKAVIWNGSAAQYCKIDALNLI